MSLSILFTFNMERLLFWGGCPQAGASRRVRRISKKLPSVQRLVVKLGRFGVSNRETDSIGSFVFLTGLETDC
jgi:hypothetical protein